MFDIGFTELLLVGVMGLIILGPERLPKAARTLGLLIGRIRRTMSGIQQEIEQEIRNQELQEKLKDPMTTFRDEVKEVENSLMDSTASKPAPSKPDVHPEASQHASLDQNDAKDSAPSVEGKQ